MKALLSLSIGKFYKFFCLISILQFISMFKSFRLFGNNYSSNLRTSIVRRRLSSQIPIISHGDLKSLVIPDNLMTGLNGAQDITIKVVSCRSIVQQYMDRVALAPQPAKALGELISCSVMMASSMKGQETLQINFVGNSGMKNFMTIVDSSLKVKGLVGDPNFRLGDGNSDLTMLDLIGDGQIQVIRNHPTWKNPMNGIVSLRNLPVSLNVALYLAESEQRTAAIITDVVTHEGKCDHALAVMVETLPGASNENIERAIANMQEVNRKGLSTYASMASSPNTVLDNIMDDCLASMDIDSLRWSKCPEFSCSCGEEKVIRALKLLPKSELDDIIKEGKGVEMKCEFCGTLYKLGTEVIELNR